MGRRKSRNGPIASGRGDERLLAKARALVEAEVGILARRSALADASLGRVTTERRRLAARARMELRGRIHRYEATYRALTMERRLRGDDSGVQPLRILAEGDSWFDYPAHVRKGGLIPRLEDRLDLPILSVAHAGDEVRFMLGVRQGLKLAELLERAVKDERPWDVLLFSGGGNDVVGDPMSLWIKPWKPGTASPDIVHAERFGAVLGLVRSGYEELAAIRDATSPETHIVLHAYDYAIPDGRDVCHIGPWLQPAFDYRRVPGMKRRTEVVEIMLTRFKNMLEDFAAAHRRVTLTKTQGTLERRRDWWHNELHPSDNGFDLLVDPFYNELKNLYPGRIP